MFVFWGVVSTTKKTCNLNPQSYVDFKPASLLLAEFGVQQTKLINKSTNFSNPHLPTSGYLTTKTASKNIGVEWHSHFCAASRSGHRFDDRNSSFTGRTAVRLGGVLMLFSSSFHLQFHHQFLQFHVHLKSQFTFFPYKKNASPFHSLTKNIQQHARFSTGVITWRLAFDACDACWPCPPAPHVT